MATRLTAALLLLALLHACATPRVVRLNTGQGAPLEYRPPTSNKRVKVDAEAFEQALMHLVLEAPLTLRPPQQGWLVRASYPSNDADTRWQRLMIWSTRQPALREQGGTGGGPCLRPRGDGGGEPWNA